MKRLTVALAALLLFIASSTSFAFQNEPDGFRGLKWGSAPTKDMKFVGTTYADMKMYVRPSDRLQLGKVVLTKITYCYWHDKLFSVDMDFDFPDILKVEDIAIARWGEPTHRYKDRIGGVWKGSDGEAMVGLEGQKGTLTVLSPKVSKEISAYQKKNAAKGSEKDF